MRVPDLEQARIDLANELGAGTMIDGKVRRSHRLRYRLIADWLREHPGEIVTLTGVHSNTGYRFRQRHPDLTVWGERHKPDETGRRLATIHLLYETREGDDA